MIMVGKDERTKTLGIPGSRNDVNVKIDLKKNGMAEHGIHLCVFCWLVGWLVDWLVG